ncbi:MAG: segregation/condensation protein A [Candidatus Peribacteraceae bacterium]|nr:segregation/condensation protein A [Candidatus Peribacteraceae bacterium]
MLDEKKVLDYITAEYSWEQVIYEIVAWEGLDPWDLDIEKLTEGFLKYLKNIKEVDFRVPAKFIMVAAILLKMKSDYLRAFKEQVVKETEDEMKKQMEEDLVIKDDGEPFEISPINVPPRREPVRGIVVSELVNALKKVLRSHDRKERRRDKLRNNIDITGDNINDRIKTLYGRINNLLLRVKNKELEFSKLVGKEWTRENVVNNFVPLVHLEQQKKVTSRQDEMFEEIWVRRRDKK